MKKITILLFVVLSVGFNTVKANAPDLSEAFNNIIQTYLEVKNALVTDNTSKAKISASNMLTAINSVPQNAMDAATRKIWAGYAAKLNFDVRHISESDDIKHQREHFAALSTNMLTALKAPMVTTIKLYKQYCPMKKNYWVSETADIKNPYYGSAMLTCGENKEALRFLSK